MVEAGPDQRPIETQLLEILAELANFFTDVVRKMELLRWSGVSIQDLMATFEEPPPIRDIKMISAWLQRCHQHLLIRDVDFDLTAMMILTSMHGPAMLKEFLGRAPTGHSQEEFLSRYVELLLHGLLDSKTS